VTSVKNITAFILLLLVTVNLHSQSAFAWPNNKKAAIVLTYDDALASQLNVAIPQLNKAKMKGTFFLDGRMNPDEVLRWRLASQNGHELGNHTLFHPCSSAILKNDPHYLLENYSVDTMLKEISVMNGFLFAIDNQRTRNYAYTCSESVVGNTEYVESLKRSGLIRYARSGGDKNSIVTDFKHLDPYRVPSWGFVHKPEGAELIDFVKRVQQIKGMGVLMFHGVGGDYLEVSADAHAQLLEYLQQHKDEIWVGTFQEVMDYITQKK
jgi:peptidoglycan/xylan/chitin deacetylase (PgdA/CDA1 family)